MKNEPVRFTYLAAAIVGALVSFGVPIPERFRELVTGLLVVALPVIAGEIARRFTWGPETVKRALEQVSKAGALLLLIGLPLALQACSQVTSTDRAKTAERAVEGLRATCLLYGEKFSGIPQSPELDAVCPVLLGQPVVTVPETPAPVPTASPPPQDAGTEAGP